MIQSCPRSDRELRMEADASGMLMGEIMGVKLQTRAVMEAEKT